MFSRRVITLFSSKRQLISGCVTQTFLSLRFAIHTPSAVGVLKCAVERPWCSGPTEGCMFLCGRFHSHANGKPARILDQYDLPNHPFGPGVKRIRRIYPLEYIYMHHVADTQRMHQRTGDRTRHLKKKMCEKEKTSREVNFSFIGEQRDNPIENPKINTYYCSNDITRAIINM